MYIPTTVLSQSAGLSVIFDATLGADTAIIDTGAGGVTGIATTLIIRMLLRTDEAAATSTALVRVNGNSGNNYDQNRTRNLNVTVAGTTPIAGTSWIVTCAGAQSLASVATPVRMEIPFYTATSFLKTCLIQAGAGGDTAAEMFNEILVGTFRTTSAITQISVAPGGGTVLVAGSRLQVLGSI